MRFENLEQDCWDLRKEVLHSEYNRRRIIRDKMAVGLFYMKQENAFIALMNLLIKFDVIQGVDYWPTGKP